MNRTFLAALVLALALLTLVLAWHGARLSRQAQIAQEEWRKLEQAVERKSAEMAQRQAEDRERRARRLALTYRLKKVAGKRAQAAATGASPESLQALDREILALEDELRRLGSGKPAAAPEE